MSTAESAIVRDGSRRRETLESARAYHSKHLQRIDEELQRVPGSVSTRRILTNTRKWLEGMSTPRIRAHAQRLGVDPEDFESLEDLIHALMFKMGIAE